MIGHYFNKSEYKSVLYIPENVIVITDDREPDAPDIDYSINHLRAYDSIWKSVNTIEKRKILGEASVGNCLELNIDETMLNEFRGFCFDASLFGVANAHISAKKMFNFAKKEAEDYLRMKDFQKIDLKKTKIICEEDPAIGGYNIYFVGQLKVVYLEDDQEEALIISSNPNSLEKRVLDVANVKKNVPYEGRLNIGLGAYDFSKVEAAIEYFKRPKCFEGDEEFVPSYYTLLEFIKKIVKNGN